MRIPMSTAERRKKIEIAFLPYKASMWDSLESIYFAAKNDPDCETYVVPIPYYDRLPDGSFGEMHYEGDKYPNNIPITNYKDYNIEERRPDVIFIHNPYDNFNSVVSVDPRFYCEKLSKYTNMLCYVPYFVVSGKEEVPEHFILTAASHYAHKTILQSEGVRETYIETLKKQYSGNLEDKFVALGSPKFDKVINTKKEDCPIPDEWRELIGDKKVVFYNTTVTAILKGDEKYLKKLQNVLAVFKEHKDLVLWWRPHPLSETTYSSMRPGLLEEYKRIVERYRSEAWGIFDDSANLHRAIVWGDVYYGDGSSVVGLFEVTGKPIVVQSIESAEEIVLYFLDFAVDDKGECWAFDLLEDGLFKLDFENNTARYIARSACLPKINGKKYLRHHRYFAVRSITDKIYCLPFNSDNILVYNRLDGETEKIPLNRDYLLSSEFDDGFFLRLNTEYQGKIYCFSFRTKAVVALDTVNNNIKYDTKLFERIGLLRNDGKFVKIPLYMSECSEDGKITLLMINCEHLIRYTLATQEIEIIASNPVLAQCVRADFDGQNFWLLSDKIDELIKWNPASDEVVKYDMPTDSTFLDNLRVFTGLLDCGEYLLFFPGPGSVLLKFDKESCRFSEYPEMPVPKDLENRICKYDAFPKRVGDKTYVFARHNNTMYELDKSSGKVIPHRFRLNKESCKSYYNNLFDSIFDDEIDSGIFDRINGVLYEHNSSNIADFLVTAIQKWQRRKMKRDEVDGVAGVRIYDYVKGCLREKN